MSNYSIDISLNSEELVELNASLSTGLKKFTDATLKLEAAGKRLNKDINFDKEVSDVKDSLKKSICPINICHS